MNSFLTLLAYQNEQKFEYGNGPILLLKRPYFRGCKRLFSTKLLVELKEGRLKKTLTDEYKLFMFEVSSGQRDDWNESNIKISNPRINTPNFWLLCNPQIDARRDRPTHFYDHRQHRAALTRRV